MARRLARRAAPLVAGLVAAASVAGCGGAGHTGGVGGGSGSGAPGATTGSTAPTTTTPTSTATGTGQTTAPTTTTVLPGTGRPQITVGDKNTPEQFILGELYSLALRAQGFEVSLTRNIGPPSVSLQAAEQGSLDVYPEYLDVWDSQLAGHTAPFRSMKSAYTAATAFAGEHGVGLLAPTPGGDTEGLAVLTSYAAANRLSTLAGLASIAPGMTIAAPIVFAQDPLGLPAVEHAYRFDPGAVEPIDIGAQYAALRTGSIQAAFVYTTDGQLADPTFTQLRDPRHVLGFGNIVPVVSDKAIALEGPTFVATIDQVDALLTTKVLRQLNAEAHEGHMGPMAIAQQFLQNHGLVPAAPSGTA